MSLNHPPPPLPKCGFRSIHPSKVLATPWQKLFRSFRGLLACGYQVCKPFWGVQETFLRRSSWLQETFEALQSVSKHQLEVTNLCFGSILLKNSFFNDVSHENPIFVLSGIGLEPFCTLQEAFVRLPRGHREAFNTLQSTFKHLQDVTPIFFAIDDFQMLIFEGVSRESRGVSRESLPGEHQK